FGTLTKNADGGFTYVSPQQVKWNFDAVGLLTGVVDTHGLLRAYEYDGQGRLARVSAPDGGGTTLEDAGGQGGIHEPGHRLVTRSLASGDLVQITDAAGQTRQFGYDAGHRLTRDQWQPYDTRFEYGGHGRLVKVDRGDGTVDRFSPAAVLALPAGPV